jgi:hypothetical protein
MPKLAISATTLDVVWQRFTFPDSTFKMASMIWKMLKRPRRRKNTYWQARVGHFSHSHPGIGTATSNLWPCNARMPEIRLVLCPDIHTEVDVSLG